MKELFYSYEKNDRESQFIFDIFRKRLVIIEENSNEGYEEETSYKSTSRDYENKEKFNKYPIGYKVLFDFYCLFSNFLVILTLFLINFCFYALADT